MAAAYFTEVRVIKTLMQQDDLLPIVRLNILRHIDVSKRFNLS